MSKEGESVTERRLEGDSARPSNPNAELIREIERIALQFGAVNGRTGEPDLRELGEKKMERSHNFFGTVVNGGEPRASTLLDTARYARISPLRLYAAAGWFTEDDIVDYLVELQAAPIQRLIDDPRRLAELLQKADVTERELAEVAQTVAPLLARQAEDRRREARRQVHPLPAEDGTADEDR